MCPSKEDVAKRLEHRGGREVERSGAEHGVTAAAYRAVPDHVECFGFGCVFMVTTD